MFNDDSPRNKARRSPDIELPPDHRTTPLIELQFEPELPA
jgi:hypothetical protein